MIICKRTLLIVLLILALCFIGYQILMIVQKLNEMDNETKYVHLVDQYQVLKMERLVLEEQYNLSKIKDKVIHLAAGHEVANIKKLAVNTQDQARKKLLPCESILSLHYPSVTEPIALSLDQAKTFEQLEAYVSNNKPLQPQSLSQDEKMLLASPPDNFTLQLMGVRESSELTRFVNENHVQNARVFHTYYLNKDWYVLVLGSYKNHTEAVKAIDNLPSYMKNLKPWIRQLSTVQKAIQLYR